MRNYLIVIAGSAMVSKFNSKRKIVWFALLMILLAATLLACAEKGKGDLIEEEQYAEKAEEHDSIEEFEPTFLELEYMYSFEVDYFLRASLVEGEFTWFETFGSGGGITFDEVNVFAQRMLHLQLPETIDLDGNSFITVSIGRRLLKLYYFEESRYDTLATLADDVFARPVFEREYYPNTVFVYRVAPLPKYSFIDQQMFTDDFMQFNTFNNIPFEVWPYDRSMSVGEISSPGWQIRGSALGRGWKELTEPLHGYIHAQETYLRNMPTNYSQVVRRLLTHECDFIIIGYVEGGMEIDGSGRWYYVRTLRGNRLGYIHSSFVSICNDKYSYG